MSDARFEFERAWRSRGCGRIAGMDEAGRGPLAGPVVAAAVVLPEAWSVEGLPPALRGLNDSKQVAPARRVAFFEALQRLPSGDWAVAVVTSEEIDHLNILRATHAGMARALAGLVPPPEHVLVDGLPVSTLSVPQTPLVKGDSRSYSIAAASILAKVTRDRLMEEYDARWPEYGFAVHKGYPTPAHRQALARWGPCPIHRRSFAPVSNVTGDLGDLFGA